MVKNDFCSIQVQLLCIRSWDCQLSLKSFKLRANNYEPI